MLWFWGDVYVFCPLNSPMLGNFFLSIKGLFALRKLKKNLNLIPPLLRGVRGAHILIMDVNYLLAVICLTKSPILSRLRR